MDSAGNFPLNFETRGAELCSRATAALYDNAHPKCYGNIVRVGDRSIPRNISNCGTALANSGDSALNIGYKVSANEGNIYTFRKRTSRTTKVDTSRRITPALVGTGRISITARTVMEHLAPLRYRHLRNFPSN